jgi:isoprenylcysteine carboxyl methyltransferase (ICMT) family protein YpbQ
MGHGHYWIYRWLILFLWIAFTLYWAISARGTKKVISRTYSRWNYVGAFILVAIILYVPRPVRAQFIPHSDVIQIAGVTVTVLGIAFAIWARLHLGKNWSPGPSIQEEHQLVTSGPYRFVRHPIYTGVLFGLFGSAFVTGLIGISIFVMGCIAALWRVKEEERIMTELFPNEYPEYKKRTKALIPFIW